MCLCLCPAQDMSRDPGGLPGAGGQPTRTFLLATPGSALTASGPVDVCGGAAVPPVIAPLPCISQGRRSPKGHPKGQEKYLTSDSQPGSCPEAGLCSSNPALQNGSPDHGPTSTGSLPTPQGCPALGAPHPFAAWPPDRHFTFHSFPRSGLAPRGSRALRAPRPGISARLLWPCLPKRPHSWPMTHASAHEA